MPSSSLEHGSRHRGITKLSIPSELPRLILDEILDLLNANGRWVLHVEDISEAKSAQQLVYILKFADNQNSADNVLRHSSKHNTENMNEWADAMNSGKNRLVLRIWKGGSRWWNLNRNDNLLDMARSEIMGYKVAKKAFDEYRISRKETFGRVPKIPRVLHIHLPSSMRTEVEKTGYATSNGVVTSRNTPSSASGAICWAILEYVGADDDGNLSYVQNDDDGFSKDALSDLKIDNSYMGGMIKIRREFGFDEPHPRWGRVPTDEALEYARTILRQVLLPLHRHTRRLHFSNDHSPNKKQDTSFENEPITVANTFSGMTKLYKQTWEDMAVAIPNLKHQTQSTDSCEGWDDRFDACIQRLERGISFLTRIVQREPTIIPPMDLVLVHLDLQPQNLIFCQSPSNDRRQSKSHQQEPEIARKKAPSVFSILDWEDAAWGDPRFDLVLLCRKVCANRNQADSLWSEYEEAISAEATNAIHCDEEGISENDGTSTRYSPQKSTPKTSNPEERHRLLGPIEPWLLLETIHSITTMLLQSVDLLNGGRNPWETKKDLWEKLRREFTRLEGYERQR